MINENDKRFRFVFYYKTEANTGLHLVSENEIRLAFRLSL